MRVEQYYEPETAADVIEGLCEDYGLNPNQRISTLMEAVEDLELDDDDQDDDEDVDQDEDEDDDEDD